MFHMKQISINQLDVSRETEIMEDIKAVSGYQQILRNIQGWMKMPDLEPTIRKLELLGNLYCQIGIPRGILGPNEAKSIYSRHIFDCLSIGDWLAQFPIKLKIMDMGTGGGLPGIPLSIVFPENQYHLWDSQRKRIDFVTEIYGKLNQIHPLDKLNTLSCNAYPLHCRIEEQATKSDWQEQFDIVVCRAFLPPGVAAELAYPFIKAGGYFVLMGGSKFLDFETVYRQKCAILGYSEIHNAKPAFPDLKNANVLVMAQKTHSQKIKRLRKLTDISLEWSNAVANGYFSNKKIW